MLTCPVGTISWGCSAAELINTTWGWGTTPPPTPPARVVVGVATDVGVDWSMTVPCGSTCNGVAVPTVAADTEPWPPDAFSAAVSWLRTAAWLVCCCCCCRSWASCHYISININNVGKYDSRSINNLQNGAIPLTLKTGIIQHFVGDLILNIHRIFLMMPLLWCHPFTEHSLSPYYLLQFSIITHKWWTGKKQICSTY